MWTAKCSCRLQAFAHLQASQGKYYEADATYGPLPNNTNRGDSDGVGFPDCPGPTAPRAVPLPPSTNHVTICPATPDSPARIGRKSMARRSGQSGSIQKEGNWYVVRYWKDVAGEEKRQRVYAKICPISGCMQKSAPFPALANFQHRNGNVRPRRSSRPAEWIRRSISTRW